MNGLSQASMTIVTGRRTGGRLVRVKAMRQAVAAQTPPCGIAPQLIVPAPTPISHVIGEAKGFHMLRTDGDPDADPGRRRVPLVWAFLLAVFLSVDTRATVTDVGQVVVGGDGSLAIGEGAFGQRRVEAETDGPYPEVRLGLNVGGHGELFLQNGASLGVTGRFAVGRLGGGVVRLSSGSTLITGSAVLYDYNTAPPFGSLLDPIDVRVEGVGSIWINAGLLEVGSQWGNATIDLVVSAGGQIMTIGALAQGSEPGGSISVQGAGSYWENLGSLWLRGDASFAVLDGAVAVDNSVGIGNSFSLTRAMVAGSGSTWTTGDFGLNSLSTVFEIIDGGSVRSSSAFLMTQAFQVAKIEGAGSVWQVDGVLWVYDSADGGTSGVQVANGGSLITGEAYLSGAPTGMGWIELAGQGTNWSNQGDVELAGSQFYGPRFDVLDGAIASTATIQGRCAFPQLIYSPCGLDVRGAGSQLTVSESASFRGDGSAPGTTGRWTVADGGVVTVGGPMTLADGAELLIDEGAVTATEFKLSGGAALSGRGEVHAYVENAGLLRPGLADDSLLIDGDYTQLPAGSLFIEIGGNPPGVLLQVTGQAALGGTLEIAVVSGFTPALGQTYPFLSASGIAGGFAAVHATGFPPGTAPLVQGGNTLVVQVAADSDGDGVPNPIDNCLAKANANQSDVDADGTGDVCDNLCVGNVTSITSSTPSFPRDTWMRIGGTGFGPNAEVTIGSLPATVTTDGTVLYAKPSPSLALYQILPVVVVNPEGCRSQENVSVTLTPPLGCGLTGVEPFVLLGVLAAVKRMRLCRHHA